MDYKLIWQRKRDKPGIHFAVWQSKERVYFAQEQTIISLPREEALELTKAFMGHFKNETKI